VLFTVNLTELRRSWLWHIFMALLILYYKNLEEVMPSTSRSRKLSFCTRYYVFGPGNSVGIATDYGLDGPGIESRWGEIFRCPDWPWGPRSLLYNGYRVFPGVKVRLGRAADHSPPYNAAVKKW
jgi:hypothetical protein